MGEFNSLSGAANLLLPKCDDIGRRFIVVDSGQLSAVTGWSVVHEIVPDSDCQLAVGVVRSAVPIHVSARLFYDPDDLTHVGYGLGKADKGKRASAGNEEVGLGVSEQVESGFLWLIEGDEDGRQAIEGTSCVVLAAERTRGRAQLLTEDGGEILDGIGQVDGNSGTTAAPQGVSYDVDGPCDVC